MIPVKNIKKKRESVKAGFVSLSARGWVEHCLHSLSVQLLCISSTHRTCSGKVIVHTSCYRY